MAESNEISTTTLRTERGRVKATLYDRVGVNRVYAMLFHGSWYNTRANTTETTARTSLSIRKHVVFPGRD